MVNKRKKVFCLSSKWDASAINEVINEHGEKGYSPISIGGDSTKFCILFEK